MLIIETTYDEKERMWHGSDLPAIYDPQQSIGDVVFQKLKENPTKKLQISYETGQVTTNKETLDISTALAQYFKAEGLTHEDVVGILTRNNLYEVHVIFACFFNVTPFHAVNPKLEPDAIANLYAITKPKLIFCDGQDFDLVEKISKNWKPKICTLINHITNVLSITIIQGEYQTMGIICSSGTTGLPKPVTLTNAQLALLVTSGGAEDVIYTTATFDWISAIKTVLISVVSGAVRIVSDQDFSPELYVDIISRYRVTSCSVSHWQFHQIFSSPFAHPEKLSSLQFVVYGGGWVSATVVVAAQKIVANAVFLYLYGTTETDVISVAMNQSKDNLVGALLPGKCVRIVNDKGINLGPNERGEIIIKTNQQWNGYYGNPAQSALTMDFAGWFHMGDLGYFDEEHNLYVVDRKKDLLKYKSMHYTPNEIERIIMELPAVKDVCVVGIPDDEHGDAAAALIIRHPNSELKQEEVLQHVARRITVDHKQLHGGVKFVDSLPHNANGKLLRNVARDMYRGKDKPRASL